MSQIAVDQLTGLLTRAAAEQQLAKSPGSALLLLDIDYFKRFNAHNGHEAGDQLLLEMEGHLRRGLEPDETLYRVGGGVFAVLLPPHIAARAVICAERLRHIVADGCNPVQPEHCGDANCMGPAPPPRISVGVAVSTSHDVGEDVFRRAELSLWMAKSLGRNQVGEADCKWTVRSGDVEAAIRDMSVAAQCGALLHIDIAPSSLAHQRSQRGCEREAFCLARAWLLALEVLPQALAGRRAGWTRFTFALSGERAQMENSGRSLLQVLRRDEELARYEWWIWFVGVIPAEPERTLSCDAGYDLAASSGHVIAWVEPYPKPDWRQAGRYPTVTRLPL